MTKMPPSGLNTGATFFCDERIVDIETPNQGQLMNRFTMFVVLSTLVALPLLLRKIGQNTPLADDENTRYDIEDLLVEEAL